MQKSIICYVLLILLFASTGTNKLTCPYGLWSFTCHNLNSCSKASSSHPYTTPPEALLLSLSSRREWKWHFWACNPQLGTTPRSCLTAAHSRWCQPEIILSVKLSNEARDTDAPKNKHALELWESTFAFEERWEVVGRIKWMKWRVFVFMPHGWPRRTQQLRGSYSDSFYHSV